MKKIMFVLLVVGFMFASLSVHAEEEVLFGFEAGLEGWDVPDWAYEKPDYVQREINLSDVADGVLKAQINKTYRRFYLSPSRLARVVRDIPNKRRLYGGFYHVGLRMMKGLSHR